MKLALYVNVCRRPELTERCLVQIDKVKYPGTSVMLIQDGYERGYLNPNRAAINTGRQLGVGPARRFAIETAVNSECDLYMFMDDDLFVLPGFDMWPVELWFKFRHRHPDCFGSAFRSNEYHHLHREIYYDDYVFGTSIPGSCIIMERPQAIRCLNTVNAVHWNNDYDWRLSSYFPGRIVPFRTYAYNVGIDPTSVHHPHYNFDYYALQLERQNC